MSDVVVMKFGGTSVGSPEAIGRLAQIVRDSQARRPTAVVVSAMNGVTDSLLAAALAAAAGDVELPAGTAADLRRRHQEALRTLAPRHGALAAQAIVDGCHELEALCHAMTILGEASARALDAVASLGERMSAPLVAAALEAAGVPARAVDAAGVIVTDSAHQSAVPDLEATAGRAVAAIRPLLEAGVVPVVTGFIGATPAGAVTTLGRGGSDFSAAILGVALGAAEVWIWTDVDGVMTADPRLVPDARTQPELTFREISELAFYGARVLHPKTIRPVVERGITLWVKNTFRPEGPGTRIVPDRGAAPGQIRAVTTFRGQCIITLEGRGMLGIPGIAARTFAAVARTGTSVAMISQASSEQSICFIVPHGAAEGVRRGLEDEFQRELARRDIDGISLSGECAVITVVGAGMRHTPGVAGRVFGALGQAGANVVAIAQGSSECSISLAVDAADGDRAVRAIHALIGT